ncbi:MAG: hypothetical protein GC168_07595 [Candidatus Hydrogenedens sp.]|nr:hypothetical protein [Candidatus Hydrogenedens sp.]
MFTVFLVCAAGGSTLLIIMFALTFMGLDGGHGMGDLDGAGHDLHTDFSGEADARTDLDMLDDAGEPLGDSTVFFHALSIRSIVAGVAFFGLGGLLAQSIGAGPYASYVAAILSGAAALFAVAWLMHLLYALKHDGTFQIISVLGAPATVYLAIPAARSGSGKVTVAARDRSVELEAVTDGDALPTGALVEVVEILNENTVAVKRPAR